MQIINRIILQTIYTIDEQHNRTWALLSASSTTEVHVITEITKTKTKTKEVHEI